ncbi:MAG: SMC family ATPase [Candidatus Zixiibacteriota bacterium]|nr:MAG: SMC family ATPase [candidate division Zixibacteria bacterium]
MRLQQLCIRNYRVFRSVELEFPDSVIGIIGPNGAGKSSIVEAMAWCLYGNMAARSSKNEIKSSYAPPTENCEVRLQFEVSGEHYRAVRRLTGRTNKPEVELYCGDESVSIGSTETAGQITEILGLDFRGFLTSFLARQQELNALSDLPPHKRREHLAGMLGIQRLDRAIEQARMDIKLNEAKEGALENRLTARDSIQQRIEEIREHVKTVRPELDRLAGARNARKARLSELIDQYREQELLAASCSRLKAEAGVGESSQKHLADQEAKLISEVAGIREAGALLEQQQLELERLQPAVGRLDALRGAKTKAALRGELLRHKKSMNDDMNDLGEQITESTAALERVEAELVTPIADLEMQYRRNLTERELTRSDWAACKAQCEAVNLERERLSDQLVSIEKVGPETICDRCLRPFGDDLVKIREHLESERVSLDERSRNLGRELDRLRTIGERLSCEVTDLDRLIKRMTKHQAQRESLERSVSSLKQRRDGVDAQYKENEKRLNEIGEVAFDQSEYDRMSDAVSALEPCKTRVNQLSGLVQRLERVEQELEETRSRKNDVAAELGRLRKELTDLGFDEVTFKKLSVEIDKARREFEATRDACVETAKELELMEHELNMKLEQLSEIELLSKELDSYRTSRFYGERLVRLFGDYRKHVIARIRPRLAELSSQLMAEMTDGRYHMVELDEQYNMSVFDSSQFYGIERFSGGEKDLANLCLRLAISQALAESAGMDRSFVILDEVFGSQDDERRDLVFDGLVNLRNRFPQMFLITHVDGIKHKVETLFEVDRSAGGWSEVRLNGKLV